MSLSRGFQAKGLGWSRFVAVCFFAVLIFGSWSMEVSAEEVENEETYEMRLESNYPDSTELVYVDSYGPLPDKTGHQNGEYVGYRVKADDNHYIIGYVIKRYDADGVLIDEIVRQSFPRGMSVSIYSSVAAEGDCF